MKITTFLYLAIFGLCSSLFVSCEDKKRSSSNDSSSEAASVDTAESLTDEMTDIMHRFADTLAAVKDKESATQAGEKIDTIYEELEALAARFDKLEDPSPEEKKQLKEKMDKVESELDTKLSESFQSFKDNTEVMETLKPIMKNFKERMDKLEPTFEKFGVK
ncbi:hypothetical protein HW115_08250 [Verrucomicrobiaceae bacterium N1E253]|uniref:Uncharacterized protein n=1 Tax=Oceaniferula marina TaxID=2748318 RepID=A0A851GLG6_9BACT|nr:hypothetical protein [Oceaniferula marina]NWK55600.1 hypothetical protein [Oceaniferula marina]